MELAITFDDLDAFLESRKAGAPCPVCRCETWYADIPTHDHLVLRKWVNPVEGDRPARLRVTMVCSNCGLVREHDLDTILEWKKSNP